MTNDHDIDSELEAVQSIFPEIIHSDSTPKRIIFSCNSKSLLIVLTNLYALDDDPKFEINGPNFSAEIKQKLFNKLKTTCKKHTGEPILYFIAKKIVSFANSELIKFYKNNKLKSVSLKESSSSSHNNQLNYVNKSVKIPEIYSGRVFEDRKSVFQAHFAFITSKEEVDLVLDHLKNNNKIGRATHNIYAYRFLKTLLDNSVIEQKDCDCDGETGAGPKILRLLHLMKITNVVVIVTRWYGGIHLGPDRFRHIANLAREIILEGQKALINNNL